MKKQITKLKKVCPVFAFALIALLSCDDNNEVSPPIITSFSPASAAVGAEITITGTNFSTVLEDNSVWFFDGVQATVTAATATSITATVPDAAKTGPLAVIVNREIVRSSDDFEFAGPFTLKIKVTADSDDAEEGITGTEVGDIDLGSSDLEFGEIEGGTRGQQMVGIRFADITIPNGANITSASIQFTVDEDVDNPAPVVMTIYGEAADNATTYEEVVGNISARSLTTASVEWNIPEWQTVGEAGDDQRTVDLTSIVQEIVDRSGWSDGNSLNFIFQPTTETLNNPTESGRVAESSGDAAGAPELTIVFEL